MWLKSFKENSNRSSKAPALEFLFGLILFENLFKPRQRRLTGGMVTDFVSSIYNLKAVL